MAQKRSIDEINAYLESNNATYRVVAESERVGYLECSCKVCNQTFTRKRNKIHQSCPICKNKVLVVGYNDIETTAKWMIPYLKDKEDAHRYMKSSGKRIMYKCPECGYEKNYKVNTVYCSGFSCDLCSDGLSRPNKFIRTLMLQLPVENLDFEYCSEWTNGKHYDVYFEYKSEKYVIEMDGEQHYVDTNWGKAYVQQLNDGYKNLLSWQNGINIIRINCKHFDYEKVIKEFDKSVLGELINKSNIDWQKCITNAEKSYLLKVCNYYSEHPGISINELSEFFHFSCPTIRRYLTTGFKLGFCSYNAHKERIRLGKVLGEKRKTVEKEEFQERTLLVSEFANKHKTMTKAEMSKHLNLATSTIAIHIKAGIEQGICTYSTEDVLKIERVKAAQKGANLFGKKLSVYKDSILVGKFNNMKECFDTLNTLYPSTYYCHDTVRKQLVKKKRYLYKGLLFVSD